MGRLLITFTFLVCFPNDGRINFCFSPPPPPHVLIILYRNFLRFTPPRPPDLRRSASPRRPRRTHSRDHRQSFALHLYTDRTQDQDYRLVRFRR